MNIDNLPEFKVRPVQEAALALTYAKERSNVFADPGLGKTSTMLMTLITRDIMEGDVFPALVVAPKRVANAVWDAEVESWAQFAHLKVSKVLGTAQQRKDALKKKAHIYCINYENLKWLAGYIGLEWIFKTVIVDESTKIRGHRCSYTLPTKNHPQGMLRVAGTLNARALVKYRGKTRLWYNLSGTPTPKSEIDLWAQQWAIDGGRALGRTFSEFTARYFRKPYGADVEDDRWEVMPNMAEQITDAIKPNTVVLKAYDWLDIERPIELNIPVELPPAVRKTYNEMHKQSVIKLLETDTDITALNAAAVLMKCRQIASGAVLDENGEIHVLHEERLHALKELYERINQPLLVAYNFRYEKDAICRFFNADKDVAVPLPNGATQKEVEARWNRGEIPMLLVHPASAGHGLNLQHGSNHCVIFTPDWNYELYAQVIERVGSTRQKQSGYDRPVYIHRFYAPKTIDEVVLASLGRKHSVSETVKDALRVTEQSLIQPS